MAAVSRSQSCSVNTVKLWRDRFLKERISGLWGRYLGKAVAPGTERLEARIIDWTLHHKDGSTHWSSRKLAAQLGISHMRVARVWAKAGLQRDREKPGAERVPTGNLGPCFCQMDPLTFTNSHILLLHINPPVWRRLHVRSDTSIAMLHELLQIAFDWSDFHLHRFLIRGKAYGMSRLGGCGFTTDARKVVLSQFRFRTNERFLYEYDFVDLWQHQIRFESVAPIEGKKSYLVCIAGRASSTEDCGGPEAYRAEDTKVSKFRLVKALAALSRPAVQAGSDFQGAGRRLENDGMQKNLRTSSLERFGGIATAIGRIERMLFTLERRLATLGWCPPAL